MYQCAGRGVRWRELHCNICVTCATYALYVGIVFLHHMRCIYIHVYTYIRMYLCRFLDIYVYTHICYTYTFIYINTYML